MAKKALLKKALKYLKKVAKNPTKIKTKAKKGSLRAKDAALGLGAMGAAGFGTYAATKEINKLKKKLKNRKKGKKK